MPTQPDPLDDFLEVARIELDELRRDIDRALLQLDKADRVEDDRNRRAFADAVEAMMRQASRSLNSLLDVYGLDDEPAPVEVEPIEIVRNLLAEHDAADAPAALAAHLADAYRIAVREVGPRYALANLQASVERAAAATAIIRTEYGPRATWSPARGHHAADVEGVTR